MTITFKNKGRRETYPNKQLLRGLITPTWKYLKILFKKKKHSWKTRLAERNPEQSSGKYMDKFK